MLLVVLFGALAAIVLGGFLYERRCRYRDTVLFPAPGRMVDIGHGTRLHIYELGSPKGPAVIFESGLCASSLNWRALQKALAPFARVIAYDRAGLGWSDAPSSARTPFNLAVELRSLLEEAEIEPPYIFVGHSFGAFVVQRFSTLYRRDVAGVVLLDPLFAEEWRPLSPERQRTLEKGIRLARRGGVLARCGLIRCVVSLYLRGLHFLPRIIDTAATGRGTRALARITEQVRKMPREVWPSIARHWSQPRFFRTAISYLRSLPASAEETAGGAPLTGMPVVVVTGEKNGSVERASVRAIAPDGFHIRAGGSGHWIHLDQPELVTEIIQDMIEITRQDFVNVVARRASGF